MKICVIEERYPPRSSGGASNYAKRSADALSDRGHEVTVITTRPFRGFLSGPSIRMDGDVKVVELLPLNIYDAYVADRVPIFVKPLFHLINLWNIHHYVAFRKILETEMPDVVHIHSVDSLSLSLFGSVNSVGVPSVITIHGFALLCPKVTMIHSNGEDCEVPHLWCGVYRDLRKMILEGRPTMVLAPSQFILDRFSEKGFFDGCTMTRIPLFVDGGERQDKKMRSDADKKKSIEILYVGRLGYHKGVHVLIEAFKRLPYQNASLHIVGSGDYEDKLRRISTDDTRILFHGEASPNEIDKHFACSDITVVPSICQENSPYVIYESFNAGKPVIASRIGGIPELIEEGYNGSLFEPGNVDALESALVALIEDRGQLETFGRNARESALSYAVEQHIQRLEEAYEEAIRLYKSRRE